MSERPLEASTLVDLLSYRAEHQPNQRAYTFLLDGEAQEAHLTYAELDRQARKICALLQDVAAAGERALLLYPPGLDYIAAFFGCLYAGVVAVPAYPPNPARLERMLPRLQAVAASARPLVALTTSFILPIAEALTTQGAAFRGLRWLATDTLSDDLAGAAHASGVDATTLALLQYTSGSTAAPKGVMLTHGNLWHNLGLIHQCFEHTPNSRGVIWLPPYHDMGLIGGILQPLYGGFPVVLMSPIDFLQRPLRWLQALSRYQATTSGGPNFAYDLCVRKISPEQRAELDLRSWHVAFNGAEPIRKDTLERFAAAFRPCGFRIEAFYPCYGLAEATLIVTGGSATAPPVVQTFQRAGLESSHVVENAGKAASNDRRDLVGCGQALRDQHIVIIDPVSLTRCPPDRVGEVWVAGPSVAQGYWDLPVETEQSFHAVSKNGGAGPFLRTGDLGFIHGGELFITGRLKDLIIIRGRNHYPQDIELTVERSHVALRPGCGAAFSVEIAGEERLAIVQEVERQYRDLDVERVTDAIRQAVAQQHELRVYAVALIKPGSIPKTSSGKIQRHACRAGFLAGDLELIGSSILDETALDSEDAGTTEAPCVSRGDLLARAPTERQVLLEGFLRTHVAQLLRVAPTRIDSQQSTGALGIDSLMAVELQHVIEAHLGVLLPMVSFLEGRSIAQLATDMLAQLGATPEAPEPGPAPAQAGDSTTHPLSAGQRALWFLTQLAPTSTAYHIISAVRIQGDLNVGALRRAFQALLDRHPSLRTTFPAQHGEPIQQIHPHAAISFQVQDSRAWEPATLDERLAVEAQQPFELEHGPLLRVYLFIRSSNEQILLLVVHHIVADLWSLAVLTQELGRLYTSEQQGQPTTLAPPALRYADYARRQAAMLAGPQGERLWTYWHARLADAPQVLELPTDRPRPPLQTYRGSTYAFTLGPDLTGRLKGLAQAAEATPYMALLAAFQVLLYRYTGQDDFLVGSPTAARSREELANIVGYFVNPVVLRADLSIRPAFTELLAQTRRSVQAALAHQEYPFALLVERMHAERDPSRSPIFQVMFVLQKAPVVGTTDLAAFALGRAGARMQLGDLAIDSIALEQRSALVDLTLMVADLDGSLIGSLQYNADLFDEFTIARMAGHFEVLLAGIIADPDRQVATLPLLTTGEQRQLLIDWNQTEATYPRESCAQELFEAQVARTPEAIAVVFESRRMTYGELNTRANQLAHYLRRLGVGPDTLVGLCAERSLEMIVGMLGILKAGGAYMPLDPGYPAERLRYMLEDSAVPVVLTFQEPRTKPALSGGEGNQEPTSQEPRTKPALSEVEGNQEPTGQESTGEDTGRVPSGWFSVLGSGEGSGSVVGGLWSVVDLSRDWRKIAREPEENPKIWTDPDQRAYVIYTSGSTGRPKGVMVKQRGLLNLCYGLRTFFDDPAVQQTGLITSISFDISVNQIFPTLLFGRTLHIVPNEVKLESAALLRFIQEHCIQLLDGVPSYFQAVLKDLAPRTFKTDLRYLLIGGEKLEQSLLEAIFTQLGTQVAIVNIYGLTEISDINAFSVLRAGDQHKLVTVGRPLQNNRIYLTNPYSEVQPVGVVGEICIAGESLSRGYLNRPELTAEKFVPCPFEDGMLMCRTGDLGRRLPDGTIVVLGRSDHQVKIRGYRIELGDIEAAVLRHPAVREVVVVASPASASSDKRLVAYLVPTTDNRRPTTDEAEDGEWRMEDGSVDPSEKRSSIFYPPSSPGVVVGGQSSVVGELRAFLKQKLPDYMVPSAFVFLDSLPLTPNGKVDRRVLLALNAGQPRPSGTFVAPRTPLEEQLAAIWSAILGVEQVGIHDNFFELGGHSLKATQVIARMRDTFRVDLPLHKLFEEPTVAGLARLVEQPRQPPRTIQGRKIQSIPRGDQSIDQLRMELESLSEDEILALLEMPKSSVRTD